MNLKVRITDIIDNVEKIFYGNTEVVEHIVISLLCGGHVLIEDVPGIGKTTLALALSQSIDGTFKRIQFTPDVMPSDITGFSFFNQKTQEFEYYSGAVMNNILLADEINRTSPKTQSSLLEAMEENQVTVDGLVHKLPEPFMVLATQNPVEFLGTYPLPEAQLDRFFMKLRIGYPTEEMAMTIMRANEKMNHWKGVSSVVNTSQLIELQQKVRDIYICDALVSYILKIMSATRSHSDIKLGGSPRCGIHLMLAAKAWAAYDGRNYVVPEDIKKFVIPILAHRLVMKEQLIESSGNVEKLLGEILNNVQVPLRDYEKK